MKERIIPIKGMHCKACTIVIADELEKIPGVITAKASLKSNTSTIQYVSEPTAEELDAAIKAAGYTIGDDRRSLFSKDKVVYEQFVFSFATLVVLLVFLRGMGVTSLNLNSLSGSVMLMALAVGVTAGFSTCMAMVGGLVLGISARYSEMNPTITLAQKFRPHLFFNLGRILTFFVLGGVLGMFGSVFRFNSSVVGMLTIGVGAVMVVLGLQLTELFPKLTNKGISLPAGIAKVLGMKGRRSKEYNHKNAMLLGATTFFLPCGFTQAMQLVAISSGSFVTGSLVMGLFAIGTAPGLLGVGALTSAVKGTFAKSLFRFVGVAVVLLAFYNISNGFNLMGYKLSRTSKQTTTINQPVDSTVAQTGSGDVLTTSFTVAGDITPSTFNVEVGKQYILEVDAKENGQGCMSTIMIPGIYKTPQLIKKGKLQLPFKIDKPGTYQITCAMGIPRGTITAVKAGN